jgi:pullulanase/glycogen debranching enzyme
MISNDPVLRGVKLIAEAWDAGGLYQVGSFPHWGIWAEWNGKFRDDTRSFIRGVDGFAGRARPRVLSLSSHARQCCHSSHHDSRS